MPGILNSGKLCLVKCPDELCDCELSKEILEPYRHDSFLREDTVKEKADNQTD
jgi:hypothetical protein